MNVNGVALSDILVSTNDVAYVSIKDAVKKFSVNERANVGSQTIDMTLMRASIPIGTTIVKDMYLKINVVQNVSGTNYTKTVQKAVISSVNEDGKILQVQCSGGGIVLGNNSIDYEVPIIILPEPVGSPNPQPAPYVKDLMATIVGLSKYKNAGGAETALTSTLTADTTARIGLAITGSGIRYQAKRQSARDLLSHLSLMSRATSLAVAKTAIFHQDVTNPLNIIIANFGSERPTTITLSQTNGGIAGRVTVAQGSADTVINDSSVYHGAGEYRIETPSADITTSRNKYGIRAKNVNVPEVLDDATASQVSYGMTEPNREPNTVLKCRALYNSLVQFNNNYQNILNTKYTITDDVTGVTYTDYVVLEYTWTWPNFRVELRLCKLGLSYDDLVTALSQNASATSQMEKAFAGNNVCFKVKQSAAQYLEPYQNYAVPGDVPLEFGTEVFDITNNFSVAARGTYPKTNTFKAPIAGVYAFQYNITMKNESGNYAFIIANHYTEEGASKNTECYDIVELPSSTNNLTAMKGNFLAYMDKGDMINLTISHWNPDHQLCIIGILDFFSGYLVSS